MIENNDMTDDGGSSAELPVVRNQLEALPTEGVKPAHSPQFWIKQRALAIDERETWLKHSKDAYDEYAFKNASEKSYSWDKASSQHIALYWATMKTLKPTLYSNTPNILAKRRFDTDDPLSRVGSLLLERTGQYLLDTTRFDQTMEKVVENALITALGCARVYVKEESTPFGPRKIVYPAWVSYDLHLHTPGARCYEDIWWKSYDHYFDKTEFDARFPGKSGLASFTYTTRRTKSEDGDNDKQQGEFALVMEIWDERAKQVLWISPDKGEQYLDVQPDIYQLVKFFPSPECVQGTTDDESMYPVPDYVQIRQSLSMLDFLQGRKRKLVKALKVKGVYDASQTVLETLISEADDVDIVPVENYTDIQDEGGINSMIDYMDVSKLAASLMNVYDSIDREIALLDQLLAVSDVIRGQGAVSESATMTSAKTQAYSVRTKELQKKIALFGRNLAELMIDLAIKEFDVRQIIEITGAPFFSEADKPYVMKALQMLKNDQMRTFRIEIETDSTLDTDIEKGERIEVFNTLTTFFQTAVEVSQNTPELLPVMSNAAQWAVRGMRHSTQLEGEIESGFTAIAEAQAAAAQQPPPPDPEIELEKMRQEHKTQLAMMKQQSDEAKIAVTQEKTQLQAEIKAKELEIEMERAVAEAQEAQQRLKIDQLEAVIKVLQSKDKETPSAGPLDAKKVELEEMKIANEKLKLINESVRLQKEGEEGSDTQNVSRSSTTGGGGGSGGAMHFHIGGGTKVGKWVDGPDGRQLVVKEIDGE